VSRVDLSIDEGPCEAACDPEWYPHRREHWFNPGGSPFGPSLHTTASRPARATANTAFVTPARTSGDGVVARRTLFQATDHDA
jgi:hypothetical protein